MKRTLFIIALVAAVTYLQAQCKTKVVSAYNYTNNGQLDKAKKYIDEALSDACPDTKDWAKTWYYAGNLYLAIQLTTEEKYKKLDTNALNKAYDAYQKAIELDTKKEYYTDMLLSLYVCGEQYYNKGVASYSAKKYEEAMNFFDKTATINATFGYGDSLATYNAALCAEYAELPDKAIEYYKKLIKINYLKPAIYSSLINIYRNKYLGDNPYKNVEIGDDTASVVKLMGRPSKVSDVTVEKTVYKKWDFTNKFFILLQYGKVYYYNTDSVVTEMKSYDEGIKMIVKGEKLFPDDNTIIMSEVNLYLTANKLEDAKKALDKLKEKDPTNPTVYYAIGNAYYDQYTTTTNSKEVRDNAYTEGEKAYKKAIELKTDYLDAIYMLGALYFMEGNRVEKESEDYMTDMAKFSEYKTKYENLYNLSKERLEKSLELDPKDYNTLISLKKLYAKLNLNDKLKEIDNKLKQLN